MYLTPGCQMPVSGSFNAPVSLTPKYARETETKAEVAFEIDV
jgi:hypothetical protein